MVRFRFKGVVGVVLPGGFVLMGECAFHASAASNELAKVISSAQARSARRYGGARG